MGIKKQFLVGFSILLISIILGFSFTPALAGPELEPPISISTDKDSYNSGDMVRISGEVAELIPDSKIFLKVFEPTFGRQVVFQQPEVTADKKFSIDLLVGGIQWSSDGTYTISVLYGEGDISAETTFEFVVIDSFPAFPPSDDDADSPRITPRNNDDEPAPLPKDDELTPTSTSIDENLPLLEIPQWIRDTAKWWSEGSVTDSDFTGGISFMIKESIIIIPDLLSSTDFIEEKVPEWVKKTAGWWSDGLTSDQEFANAIKFLVENGLIQVNT